MQFKKEGVLMKNLKYTALALSMLAVGQMAARKTKKQKKSITTEVDATAPAATKETHGHYIKAYNEALTAGVKLEAAANDKKTDSAHMGALVEDYAKKAVVYFKAAIDEAAA